MRNPGAGRAQRKWPATITGSEIGRTAIVHTRVQRSSWSTRLEGYPYPDVEPWLNLDRKRRVEAGDARRRRRGPPGPTTVVVLASRRFARHRVRQHVLIISGTMSRFSRARSQVLSSRGFAEATWLPDLWAGQCAGLPDHPCSRTYSLPTRKHASAGVAMGVFEDDATYLGTEPQIDARGTIAEPDSQA